MSDKSDNHHSDIIRLAERDAVAADMCGCGALQVHLGELSLRLPAEAVANLARTLSAELARRQTLLASRANTDPQTTRRLGGEAPRGKA